MSLIIEETGAVRSPVQSVVDTQAQPFSVPNERLSPAQRFMATSLLVLVCGMAIVGWWIAAEIERGMLDRSAYTTALYVDSFVADIIQELVRNPAAAPQMIAQLENLLDNTRLGHEVVALKVWSPDGTVIYSANPDLIGRRFPISDSLSHALGGHVTAELSNLDEEENASERGLGHRLLEIYSPIRNEGSGDVIASIEYYQRVDELEQLITTARQRTWLIIGLITLAMYLLLSGFVQRSSFTIVSQRSELRRQVARLQEVVAENVALDERVRRAAARSAASNERLLRRISSELHDGPAQYISLALLRLDLVDMACAELPESRRPTGEITAIQSALKQALQEVRALSAGLGLPQLETLSLEQVVLRAVRAHEYRSNSAVQLRVEVPPELAGCLASKITVYRVIQEALGNSSRHAPGSEQHVELTLAEPGMIRLVIADSGQGFVAPSPGAWSEQLGLAGMRDRVESLGGRFTLVSSPGTGTMITAIVPALVAQEGS